MMNVLILAFVVFSFGGLVSASYQHNKRTESVAVHAISDAEAGYDQDAYDACIDQPDTTPQDCDPQ